MCRKSVSAFVLVIAAVVATWLMACSGEQPDAAPERTETGTPFDPTTAPTSSPPVTAVPTTTAEPPPELPVIGDDILNSVVHAVATQDPAALEQLMLVEQRACEERPADIGSIQCPPGTADGTLVGVFSVGGCDEGGVVVAGEMNWEQLFEPVGGSAAAYALRFKALATAHDSDESSALYRILFLYDPADPPIAAGRIFRVGVEGIVGVRAACDFGAGQYFVEPVEIIVEVSD